MLLSLPYVIAIWISFAAKFHRVIKWEKLGEKRGAREPHPSAGVHGPISIK